MIAFAEKDERDLCRTCLLSHILFEFGRILVHDSKDGRPDMDILKGEFFL